MPQVQIANPIINSPYREPERHFLFDDQGITNQIAQGRRPSTYFVPVPRPRAKAVQTQIEWTNDRSEQNPFIDKLRSAVSHWRDEGYTNVTYTTRRLLEHWTNPERENKLFFCQIEALETIIWLSECAEKQGGAHFLEELRHKNTEANPELFRLAMKMATGSGKTVVMAMLIAWQALNKSINKQDARFTDAFLLVAPGITIRDRLRVLMPNDEANYYRQRDIIPPELYSRIGEAKILITNYHAFIHRTLMDISTTGKAVLLGRTAKKENDGVFQESDAQMVRRVLREFGNKKNIIVINDEAHHCYRRRQETDNEKLSGDEKKEAKLREEEARIWISGLEAIQRRIGIKCVYDLSATPFFLKGSGYKEGTPFQWIVSDFSLVDAIESGIVKIPRVPVEDAPMASTGPVNRELWGNIRDSLPKKGRKKQALEAGMAPKLPSELEMAIESLYSNYHRYHKRWEESRQQDPDSTPPVFIVVCNNTNVSSEVYRHISGYQKLQPDGSFVWSPGILPLFSNVNEGKALPIPNTILVDSQQLESGDAMSAEFKAAASFEIAEFKREYRIRYPERDAEKVTDEDLLREVMNTVGKKGKLGEQVRCVVSVSMLTEGWDANTVSHILGVRAFGTQLLCEQVVGRGLRRRSYAANEQGMLEPEYAEIYGVPFNIIRNEEEAGPPPQPKPTARTNDQRT